MISFEINQSKLRGGQCLPHALVARALAACDAELKPRKDVELSIAFVGEREMRALNKKWRGHDYVTDVLSFETSNEILLCYPQAVRQAKEMGHSTRDELVFLIVHGILHTFGYDHIEPKDAKKMFPRQTRILSTLGVDTRI
ncbi:MAG: rRNA maturation RNase YbeY [Candidatus Uhrbacteria bacterium]